MPKTHILVGAVRLRETNELVSNFDVCVFVFMYLCICVCVYLCIWYLCERVQRIGEQVIFQQKYLCVCICVFDVSVRYSKELMRNLFFKYFFWAAENPFEFYFTSISVLFEMSRLININSGPLQKIFQWIILQIFLGTLVSRKVSLNTWTGLS